MKLTPEHLAYSNKANKKAYCKKRAAGYKEAHVWLHSSVLESVRSIYPGRLTGINWAAAVDDLLQFKAKEVV